MKRWIGRYWISWILDEQKPLPARLAKWIAADPELQVFWLQQHALVDRLRSAAPHWNRTPSPARNAPSLSTNSQFSSRAGYQPALLRLSIGLACLLLISLGATLLYLNPLTSPNRNVAELRVAEKSQASSEQRSAEREPLAQSKLLTETKQSWSRLRETRLYAQRAAQSALKKLDNQMVTEQRLFLSDLRTTADYFLVQLPQRTSKYIGL